MQDNKAYSDVGVLSPEESDLLAALLEEEGIDLLPARILAAKEQTGEHPLSSAQRRLWFLHQLDPHAAVYNIPLAVRLKGRLNAEALDQTLGEVIRRHEALRATFALSGDEPVQVISASMCLDLPVCDLAGLPDDEREAHASRLAREGSQRPFDLASGPVVRGGLLELGREDHVVLLTMHHIVSDAWSRAVLIREVAALYQAFSEGAPSPLSELPLQYADFARWQHEWLRGEVLDDQLAYWNRELTGAATLNLPTDKPRPRAQSFRGAQEFFSLSEELTAKLNALSQDEGVTLFMTLVAAFKVLLHRYTQQDDIVIGTPVAGRNRAEVEALIGYFINTLALRTSLSGNPSFQELIQRVREVTLGAYAHQDVPFEQLIGELQVERNLSHSPVFQVVFTFQNAPAETLRLPGLQLEVFSVQSDSAKFDFTLVLEESAGTLRGSIEYNTDLFEAQTIKRWIGHFNSLLTGAVAEPQTPISLLPLLSAAERQELTSQWHDSALEIARPECLHHLFEAQVERAPEAVSIVYEGQSISYAELNRRSNQLAHYLRQLGVGVEAGVGLLMDRSIDMVVTLLGVLKAGGTYVPLDPGYPAERLSFMLDDAGVQVLLTQSQFRERVPATEARVICVDVEWDRIGAESDENPGTNITVDNAAYVIYTSGSTGRPKGVMVSHGNVARLFAATDHWFGFGADDVWALFHSYAFDFSVWELWGALLHGGKLLVMPYWVSRSPEAFYELLCNERITVLNQTPSAFRQLMGAEEEMQGRGYEGDGRQPGLNPRLVIFGGEALEFQSLAPWFARHGDEHPKLVNMYGITETTVHVSYRPLREEDLRTVTGSVIGGIIPDLCLYVLDPSFEPVPVGVPGEMYVGRAGVARGYLGRAELTAERFLPDAFGDEPGARLYRTGDLARWLSSGELEYLGRIDNQIKIRGFRIELGEIESVLSQHEAVRDVVAIADGECHSKRLTAYIVCVDDKRVTTGEMHRFARERLPEHMVPAAFVQIAAMPLTANGKLDRGALPKVETERPEVSAHYQAPRTLVEDTLALIWSEVLSIERVGVHDNFFELGGDSIRSVRILALAKQQGLDLSLRQLFVRQTIAELAQEISISQASLMGVIKSEPFSLVPVEDREQLPDDVEDAYPLTMLQAGMLYHMELMPDSSVYHNVNSWHLRAEFREKEFDEAVQYVVGRHPVLRTSFELTRYSEPLQLVHKEARLPVTIEDLRQFSPTEQEETLAAFVETETKNRFTLSTAPLLRFHIHLRAEDTFQFSLAECHPILDGWSLTSTLAEIFTRYFAVIAGETAVNEPPLAATFRDFVALERAAIESQECQRYWDEKLQDCSIAALPRWPGSQQSRSGARFREIDVPISAELSEQIQRVARVAKVPLKSVLLAAHLKVLSLLSGELDVISGVVSNGRSEEVDGERVRGLFLNTVPFRLKVEPGTWSDLVRRTFEAELELLPYRRYPLVALQRKVGNRPLFEAQFNYAHFHVLEGLLHSGNLEVLDSKGVEEEHHILEAAFGRDALMERVYLHLQYDRAVLRDEQAEAIAGYYHEALTAMSTDCQARHDRDSLLSAEERRRVLIEWNDPTIERFRPQLLHELFEAQVQRTPEAVALIFEDHQITYQELNKRANRLAYRLGRAGVGAEGRVGICAERSAELVVGLLGILKAGGSYVPLDPSYPKERLDFMMEDGEIGVLLTQHHLAGRLPRHGAKVIELDVDHEVPGNESENNPAVGIETGNIAYVIYTSGSTGRPKGVAIDHHSATIFVHWAHEVFSPSELAGVLGSTSICFDLSVFEIFVPLTCGGKVILAENALQLPELKAANDVTLVNTVPSAMAELLRVDGVPNSVQTVNLAGEPLKLSLAQQVYRLPSVKRLFNLYGPSEDTTYSTWSLLERDLGTPPSIGRPIANTAAYLLDSGSQPLPAGVAGELYIGGDGLARGYLNRPDLTAERFVPHMYSDRPGARLYRTGDLGRHLPDGQIDFLGRLDHQVKIRGFRIELGEIENVLAAHPSVSEAVVMARDDRGDKRLVAYFVAEKDEPSTTQLRSYLQEKLPEYMIPSVFVPLAALPLTPNGKLDRKRLPEPDHLRPVSEVVYMMPETETERIVGEIWKEVLQVERVGINDNFFELGGHSLLMLRVHKKLRDRFNRDVSMVEMFQYPTVKAVAEYLTKGEIQQPGLRRGQDRAEARKKAAGRPRPGAQRIDKLNQKEVSE